VRKWRARAVCQGALHENRLAGGAAAVKLPLAAPSQSLAGVNALGGFLLRAPFRRPNLPASWVFLSGAVERHSEDVALDRDRKHLPGMLGDREHAGELIWNEYFLTAASRAG
jgi:hypothetical protein